MSLRLKDTITGSISGNAGTATKLQTARTINGTSFDGSANITTANWGTARTLTIGNTGKSVNGSANISWSLSEIGAAAASHTHNYLPLSGGTITGETIFNNYLSINAWPNYGTGKVQLWYDGNKKELAANNSSLADIKVNGGYVYHQGRKPTPADIGAATSSHTHNYAGSSSAGGSANSAVKLATARTISLTGDVTGSVSFDGSGNVSLSSTARRIAYVGSDAASSNGWYKVLSQTMSGYGNSIITFAVTSTYGTYANGILHINMRSDSTSISCKRLTWLSRVGLEASHYIITISGMTWTLYAYQPQSQYGRIMFEVITESNINAKSSGITLASNSTKESTTPTASVTSSDAGAPILQTARTINGTSFNGSANITTANWGTARTLTIGNTGKSVNGSANVSWSLSEIGAAAASHTHNYAGSSSAGGNANAAVKLATARTINGTSFDGSANITTSNWGTARTLTIGSTGKSVNGSGNVTWSLAEIGAAASSHTHSYLPLSGGTLTGNLNVTGSNPSLTVKNTSNADASLVFDRGTNANWRVRNTSGNLLFESDYTTEKGSYYTALTLNYNTGNMTVKGSVTAPTFSGALSGNASTATSLQTARTINGTSFNGSANITTANWGTARTITIGSTGKSVNGSANVSWSLSEIGAAAASHTHNSLMATSLDGQTISLNTINLSSGTPKFAVYFCPTDGGGSGITGRPNDSAKNAFSLLVESVRFASSTDYITKQTYTQGNTKVMHVRYCTNGTWSAWEKVYTSVQKPTASEIGAATSSHTHNYAGSSSAGGNANAAVKLATARTINGTSFDGSANITTANWGTARTLTIGNTGKSVNGSANVSWSLSEIGAAAASHSHSSITGVTSSSVAPSTGTGVLRYDYNVPSTATGIMPNTNNANGIITLNTHSGNYYAQLGFSSNGNIYHRHFSNTALNTTTAWKQIAFTTSNVSTATTLQTARTINGTSFNGSANITTANWGTARTITIGSTGKSVNGSGNVSWSLSEIGAAAASHTHSYLPLSGGTMSGAITSSLTTATHLDGNKGKAIINSTAAGTGYTMLAKLNSTNGYWTFGGWATKFVLNYTSKSVVDAGTNNTTKQAVLLDESGNSTFPGTVTAPTFSGSLSGNAKTATTLQTARTINGTSFNGSANITTANWGTARTITIGNTGKSVNGSGNVSWSLSEIGAAAASHTHTSSQISDATNGNTANTIVKRDGSGNFSAGRISASLNGTADYAKWIAPDTSMSYGWNGVNYFNFSGTAGNGAKVNDSPTTGWWHIMRFNHKNTAGFYTDLAIPFNDTSIYYKRITSGSVQNGGWVKVLDALNYTSYVPTKTGSGASGTWGISVSGNAKTATTLQTARTINGTSFNGSANITTANWGTARTLTIGNTGKSVNGSANVSWSLSEIGAAAASHTHTSITGTSTASVTPSTGTGVLRYDYNVSSSATGNMPNSNNANGIITLNTHSGNYYAQLGFSSNGNIYHRHFSNTALNTTTAWKQIAFTTSNVSTATTLQTARTINGTSFNGSANITTANWGTARTLTIGKTGKSVNGSANVSWSLAEIGALPLTGGTMTGNINVTLYGSTQTPLKVFGGDANGQAISVGAGAATIVGAGESAKALESIATPTTENLWLAADNLMYFYTNCNTISSRKGLILDTRGTLYPIDADGSCLGYDDNRWSEIYAHSIDVTNTLYADRMGCSDIKASNFSASGTNLHLRGSGTSYNQGTIVFFTSCRPNVNGGQIMGSTNYRFGSVWCTQGVFNGSDSKLKENIKPVSKLTDSLSISENDTVTSMDLYNYVKGTGIYTFNYTNSERNTIGILADDIPQNIFDKIGVISKTDEEYKEALDRKKKFEEINKNLDLENSDINDNTIIEGTGLEYSEFKQILAEEVEEPVRLINAPAQVAMLQEVLSISLNKLDAAEQEIVVLRKEVTELKALVNQLISK